MPRKGSALRQLELALLAAMRAATAAGELLEGVQVADDFPADQRDSLEPDCVYVAGVRSRQQPAGIGPAKPKHEAPRVMLGVRVQKDDPDSNPAKDRLWEIVDAIADIVEGQQPAGTVRWLGLGDIESGTEPTTNGWVAQAAVEVVAAARLR